MFCYVVASIDVLMGGPLREYYFTGRITAIRSDDLFCFEEIFRTSVVNKGVVADSDRPLDYFL